MPIRRVVVSVICAAVIAAIGYITWQGFQLQRELRQAQASVAEIQRAVLASDAVARDGALSELQSAAHRADDRTDGAWWSLLTHVPFAGDDARGVRALSHALSSMADEAVPRLASSVDALDGLVDDGRIDLDVVDSLQDPVYRAGVVLTAAANEISSVDSAGFVGPLKTRYEQLSDELDRAASGIRSADTALTVLPQMIGANGERDYLLLFQNNAEIRATGGMPGSWALVHAEDGKLDLRMQGTAGDFPRSARPVVPLTPEEVDVYGEEYGTYFQDPGFSPDFQRGAEIWRGHWDAKYPTIELDGVLAVDPVSLSYLLRGTGPVAVEGRTLTADNAVEELLSRPYLELEPAAQDEFFAEAARAIFDALTSDLASPLDFAQGLAQSGREGRFLVAPFDQKDAAALEGSRVLGELSGDDGATPHFDVGINDGGASKMSYYLRYSGRLDSISCFDGRQQVAGQIQLWQTIAPRDAANLPVSVTGPGNLGIEPGTQAIFVRIYGPHGGTIEGIMINGKRAAPGAQVSISERQVVTLLVELDTTAEALITWTSQTGLDQTSDAQLNMTPGVASGNGQARFASAC